MGNHTGHLHKKKLIRIFGFILGYFGTWFKEARLCFGLGAIGKWE